MNRPRPNVLIVLNDDMGYSDLGCYGGEVDTPNLDRLAASGLRFTQFYNTPRCSPSRASLLTGLHPHQCGIGVLTGHFGDGDYAGNLGDRCVTMAEVLGAAGYHCTMSGKWHLTADAALDTPNGTWPTERGFHHFYGTVMGGANYFQPQRLRRDLRDADHEPKADPAYYLTDAISEEACRFLEQHARERAGQPFFQYVAYTAPHWPLHAWPEDVARYAGRFDRGWDALREARRERMIAMGLLDPQWALTARDPGVPPWNDEPAETRAWQCRRMEVYAAQIDRMDQGIGRIVRTLEATGQLDNTLILFMADNGGCSEGFGPNPYRLTSGPWPLTTRDGRPVTGGNTPQIMPGGEDTFQSYGAGWANLSNTPFRLYKHWAHEGGIATPFIAHWPAGIAARGELRRQAGYLPDVMATVLDVTGTAYPRQRAGQPVPPCEGTSLRPAFKNRAMPKRLMFWEHEGNAAVRDGRWKLVLNFAAIPTGQRFEGQERGDWELYDTQTDRTETRNVATRHPTRVRRMARAWEEWARRCGVIPREEWLAARGRQRKR